MIYTVGNIVELSLGLEAVFLAMVVVVVVVVGLIMTLCWRLRQAKVSFAICLLL
jgi:hypothetical protein